MWCSNPRKAFIPRHILHEQRYTCPIALQVSRNPQHRSLLTVFITAFAPPFQPLFNQRNVCHAFVNRFTRRKLPTVKILYEDTLHWVLVPPTKRKTDKRTRLFGSILFKHGRHFNYWNYWICIWAPYCVYLITNVYISFPSYTILFTSLYNMFRSLLDHLQVYSIHWTCTETSFWTCAWASAVSTVMKLDRAAT
jgi:hypothetical protein